MHEYLRALAAGDSDRLDTVVAEDVCVLAPDGQVVFADRAAWKEAMAGEPFEDSRIDVEEIVCEGGKVAVRYRLECVEVATGRHITTSGTKIYTVVDGRVAHIAGHDDALGVMRQLGLLEG